MDVGVGVRKGKCGSEVAYEGGKVSAGKSNLISINTFTQSSHNIFLTFSIWLTAP